jgi:hypothetical protein
MEHTERLDKCGEVHLNKLAVNLVSVPIAVVVYGAFVCVGFGLRDRGVPFDSDLWIAIVLIVVLTVLHEGLHGLAAILWGGLQVKDLKMGIFWKAMMPYCHYKLPLTIKTYRRVTMLPLYVTGLIGCLLILAHPRLWSALFAATAVSICVGDVWVFLKLRRFDEHMLVRDHPSEVGCDVFAEPSQ